MRGRPAAKLLALAAAVFVAAPSKSAPKSKPLEWTFSKRTQAEPVTGMLFPADMPPVRYPKGYHGCSAEEKERIQAAWSLAHFYMWRADGLLRYLDRDGLRREVLWTDGYTPQLKNGQGNSLQYSPRAWFGPYRLDQFHKVRGAVQKTWEERFLGRTFTVKCRTNSGQGAHPCYKTNPQTGSRPGANHIVLGTINFCAGWLDKSISWRAKGVIHEVFHWLKLSGSALWVSDIHDYYEGSCLSYRGARSLYGDKAAYIANHGGCNGRNYQRTAINNDNYALFVYMFGKAVWSGQTVSGAPMTGFPSQGFDW